MPRLTTSQIADLNLKHAKDGLIVGDSAEPRLLNELKAKGFFGSVKYEIKDGSDNNLKTIDIKVGDIVKYGSLHIEIFVCKKRPPEEVPEDFVLLRIYDEINPNNLAVL